jgi:hypothetical protein
MGNLNRVRQGLHISRLSLGNLPPRWANVGRVCAALRRELESAVMALRGEVSLADACTIQRACRWERHALLAQKWLRDNPDLPPAERLEFSKQIAQAGEKRDRALKSLGLPTAARSSPGDVLDDFYRRAAQSPAPALPVMQHDPEVIPVAANTFPVPATMSAGPPTREPETLGAL